MPFQKPVIGIEKKIPFVKIPPKTPIEKKQLNLLNYTQTILRADNKAESSYEEPQVLTRANDTWGGLEFD